MVRVERDGSVEVITLDRAERRNAIDHPTLLELLEIQARLTIDTPGSVRAVVLTGAPPAFCAGADLAGVEEGEKAPSPPISAEFCATWRICRFR